MAALHEDLYIVGGRKYSISGMLVREDFSGEICRVDSRVFINVRQHFLLLLIVFLVLLKAFQLTLRLDVIASITSLSQIQSRA